MALFLSLKKLHDAILRFRLQLLPVIGAWDIDAVAL
jgi:hypothetical protein